MLNSSSNSSKSNTKRTNASVANSSPVEETGSVKRTPSPQQRAKNQKRVGKGKPKNLKKPVTAVVNSSNNSNSNSNSGKGSKGGRQVANYIAKCRKIFETWSDEDFYGPKGLHVYYYGGVNKENVQAFRMALHEATKHITNDKNVKLIPKPIVIHLHSQGGTGDLGITLMNFLRETRIPVAVVVDGYACSAITPMLVAAPYRVMHRFSFVMIHEGWMVLNGGMKKSDLSFMVNEYMHNLSIEYENVYKTNTKIPADALKDMLSRDMFMDSVTCLKYGVVDRVIKLEKAGAGARWEKYLRAHPEIDLSKDPLLWKVNLNHLYNYNNVMDPWAGITSDSETENMIMNIVGPMQNVMEDASQNVPKPLVLHTNMYLVPRSFWFDVATLMVRVNLMRVPVVGIIDSNIDLLDAIPCIMAHRRYMYKNTYMFIRLVYDHRKTPMTYYHDIKYNTELMRTKLRELLGEYSKMPKQMLDKLFEEHVMLSASDCKKYGLIDDVIEPFARGGSAVMRGGSCSCSQGLPLSPPDGLLV